MEIDGPDAAVAEGDESVVDAADGVRVEGADGEIRDVAGVAKENAVDGHRGYATLAEIGRAHV